MKTDGALWARWRMRCSIKRFAGLTAMAALIAIEPGEAVWAQANKGSAAGGRVFVPRDEGASEDRTIGGTRGLPKRAPEISPMASEQFNLTAVPSPILRWYASAGAPGATVTLSRQGAAQPVAKLAFEGMHQGINQVDLARHRIRLEPGAIYRWSVTLDGSAPPVAAASIRYQPGRDLPEGASDLARAGYLYDALQGVRADPAAQADLLEDAGLAALAAQVRASASAQR